MTSRSHLSGTDRVSEVARLVDYDIIVNVQGDEPLIKPQVIDDVISILADADADVGTMVKRIGEPEEILDPNVVKVVFGEDGFALYFSRAPIPYHRDGWRGVNLCEVKPSAFTVYKHIGIYSYRRDALLRLTEIKPTKLEQVEKLEQLRALEHGFRIKVKEMSLEIIGVDTPQDLERVERWLSLSS